ncbi:hypothetical protein [Lactococcus lactis]|uniref:hypothetical protein n=1 Tax=Lactococcus lactis TaxID=1358 RepID=UPI0001C0545D|nr:hypothetical protein [Lactococcus lactis]ADA64761.1 Phage protein [Lactococcus lactis subsp. lactis KF147]
MSELDEFKKVVSPIAYGLAYKSEFGTTEYQQLYAEEDVIKYFNNKPSLTIPKSIAEKIDKFIKVLHFLNEFEAIKFLSALDLNGDRTPQWFKDNPMLIYAYLAGKALGVDLVKVVADD